MRLWPILLLLMADPLSAQMRPTPGTGDPRLQTIVYDPTQVVELSVASGYQLMVSFSGGERIETIAVGDSTAWQVTANKRGDYLFVKNIQPGGDTNLTVVTDARIYSFELVRASGGATDLPFMVRFSYPEAPPAIIASPAERTAYRYRLKGAPAIRPSKVSLDGDKIMIEWPAQITLPAVFRIDDDGQETLVNGDMQDGHFVVAGIPNKLIFRLDRLTATATRVRVRGSHK